MGPNNAGVLEISGLFPPEGLAGREGERQGKLGTAKIKGNPFGVTGLRRRRDGIENGSGCFGGRLGMADSEEGLWGWRS